MKCFNVKIELKKPYVQMKNKWNKSGCNRCVHTFIMEKNRYKRIFFLHKYLMELIYIFIIGNIHYGN